MRRLVEPGVLEQFILDHFPTANHMTASESEEVRWILSEMYGDETVIHDDHGEGNYFYCFFNELGVFHVLTYGCKTILTYLNYCAV